MHVVDDVQRIDVSAGQPVEHVIEARHHFVVVEHVGRDRRERRSDLLAGHFVAAAVDRVEQRLGQIDAGAEELHLLAGTHRRNAAGDGVVVAPVLAHHIVVLVLDRAGLDRLLRAVVLEALRQQVRPEYGQVRFRRRAEIGQRMQEAEAALGHQRTAVDADTADRFGHPGRVAREQRVVVVRPQETDHAQLDDQIVDQFLRFAFGEYAFLDVTLDVDVEEGADTAERHGGAVLFLDRRQIAEVGPLNGFLRVARRFGDVETVAQGHLPQLAECHDLARQFLAQADRFFLDDVEAQLVLLRFFILDQEIQAVEGDTTIVADDAPAPVGIGQAGDDRRAAGAQHVVRIGVEHALVVGAAIFAENPLDFRVDLVAVLFQRLRRHADAAERHQRALEGLVGLQADDLFQLLVDVARRMGGDVADDMRVGVDHAALVELLLVEVEDLIP